MTYALAYPRIRETGLMLNHNCPDVERAEDGMSQCLQG